MNSQVSSTQMLSKDVRFVFERRSRSRATNNRSRAPASGIHALTCEDVEQLAQSHTKAFERFTPHIERELLLDDLGLGREEPIGR